VAAGDVDARALAPAMMIVASVMGFIAVILVCAW
jgi:hypothetical protein